MLDRFPMSPQQRRLWVISRKGGHFAACARVRIDGELDREALRQALARVADRHEILRTTFERAEWMKVPEQVVHASLEPTLRVEDLAGLAPEVGQDRLEAVLAEEALRPFDLEREPLFTVTLAALSRNRHVLQLALPALCADRHALGELALEIGRAYGQAAGGEDWPGEPLQYADFARWQDENLDSEQGREEAALARAFWCGKDLPTLCDVPLPYAGNGHRSVGFRPAVVPMPADPRVPAALEHLSRRGSSRAAALLALWQAYAFRLTGRPELALGSVFDGRKLEDLRDGLGLYARCLPVRAALTDDPTCAELIERAELALHEADRWQEHGVPERVEALAGEMVRFPFLFDFGERPAAAVHADATFTVESCRSAVEPFTLSLAGSMGEGEVRLELLYDESVLSRQEAERTAAQLGGLLIQGLGNLARTVGSLDLLTPGERHLLVEDFNTTARAFPASECFHHLVWEQARRTPQRVAVVAEAERLTYGGLQLGARRLARRLRALGVGPEQRVAIFAERSPRAITAMLGVLEAGGAYLPLDPALPRERLAAMLADSGVAALLAERSLTAELPGDGTPVLLLDEDAPDEGARGEAAEAAESGAAAGAGNLMYVLFTSGSTGRPKAVGVEHRQALNYLHAAVERLELPAGASFATLSTFAADLGNTMILPALATGGCLYLISQERASEPAALAEYLDRHPVDCLKIVPSHLAALLTSEQAARILPRRRLVIGGEAASPDLLRRLRELAGEELAVFNHYGPTETTVGIAAGRVDLAPSGGEAPPLGRPLANVRLYLLDAALRPVASGILGEIYAGGANVSRGYLGRPDATAERFLPDPWSGEPGARLYRTGDLARFGIGGELTFLGRADHQVKVRGFRVELGEVEGALAALPRVREAAVLARRGGKKPAVATGGEVRLVAYFVADGAGSPTAEELRSALARKLPDAMVPAAFVRLDTMPRTTNGKLDRAALARIAPAEQEAVAGEENAPGNRSEKILAEIWRDVLRLERVGIHDNFFERGGDSILSIQVISRAARAGLRLSPRQVFAHPTIAGLAAVAEIAPESGAEDGPVTGPVPITPIQAWLFAQRPPHPEHFNQALLLEAAPEQTGGRLVPGLLRHALDELLLHHDSLRMRFAPPAAGEHGWRQWIAEPGASVSLVLADLSRLPELIQRPSIEAAAAALQASLDLGSGPLLRAALFMLGDDCADRLLLVVHHLAVDGVSWRILLEDLETAYRQLAAGLQVALPPKTTSFRLWAERLAERKRSGGAEAEGRRWLERLEGTPPPLPRDFDKGPDDVTSARSVAVALTAEETFALLREVSRAYRTRIEDVLLTALAEAFGGWTGSRRLLVDLESHGRQALGDDLDLSRTVGWFTAHVPVLLDLRGVRGPGESLKSVKEQLRNLPERELFGLLRFLGEGEVADALRALPQAEVVFNYLGQLDQILAESRLFRPSAESSGPPRSAEHPRPHRFEIAAAIAGGRLRVTWGYSGNRHLEATIEGLAGRFLAALRALITHCLTPEAGGPTPSDFPLAKLGQSELDRLVAAASGEVEDVYPLSPTQQGLLFHTLEAPSSGAYLGQLSLVVEEGFDGAAFERAWQRLVDRHSILRTAFFWEELEQPLQVVYPEVRLRWERQDWEDLSSSEQQRRLAVFLAVDRRQGFDLGRAPLMRLALIRLAEQRHAFVWSRHHLILDGWSLPVLVKELFTLYAADIAGEEARLEPAHPYSDYIAWVEAQDLAEAERFWREALAGFEAATPLPVDRRPTAAQLAPRPRVRHLSVAATEALRGFARERQLTINTLLQGAWALLLSRYSGEEDVVYGAVTSGRAAPLPGIDTMLGLFINTLPARVEVKGGVHFSDWLQDLQAAQAETRQFEYAPLLQIQSWSEVPRGQPLFDSIVAFENYPMDESIESDARQGLRVARTESVEQTHYPLSLAVAPGARLRLTLLYCPERSDSATVERLLSHLESLLTAMAREPERALEALSLLTPAERHQLTAEWNDTDTLCPQSPMVHEMFSLHARHRPEATAVSCWRALWSYGEVESRSNRLAHHLRSLGVRPEVRVAVCMGRTPERVVAILGVLKAGGAYVSLDPTYPRDRLAALLQDAGAPLMLTQERFLGLLPEQGAKVLCLDANWNAIRGSEQEAPASGVVAENLAYVIYTSGSTGAPNGVEVRHAGLMNLVRWHQGLYGVTPADRATQVASPAFDASVFELWPYLAGGASVHIADEEARLSSPEMVRWWSEEGITLASLPTLLAEGVLGMRVPGDHPLKVRALLTGGDRLHRGPSAEACFRLMNHYGPAEYTVNSTVGEIPPEGEDRGVPSIGRPMDNTRIYVLQRNLEPVPVGPPGELYVTGLGLARGYLRRPELTAEKFLPDPLSGEAGGRMYRTGDLVRYLPDGDLHFLGRIDHQVKLRGFRIELGEIESLLCQHPLLREAAVLVREDRPEHKLLVGYVVLARGEAPTTEDLRTFLSEQLPEHMVPSSFVVLAALPLTPNGKLDRHALPAPEEVRPGRSTTADAAPQGQVEELIAGVFSEVLKAAGVGRGEDFFSLGGHSLSAMQVISRLRVAFGFELPLREIFDEPTVAGLARRVEAARRGTWKAAALPLVRVPRRGPLPLSFGQQRLWFLDQLAPGTAVYNIRSAFVLRGRLVLPALAGALREIVQRHETLRTTFRAVDGEPVQVITPLERQPLPQVDLDDLGEEERNEELRRLAADEARVPFDLARGPLLRVTVLRLAAESHAILTTMHHIVSDGWSMGLYAAELAALYEACVEGRPSPLPKLLIQYADYAVWQRQWLSGPVLEAELAYWKERLRDLQAGLELPTDRPRPPQQTFRGASESLHLPGQLAESLKSLTRREGATLFMTLFAAFNVLLSRWSGQLDILVGTPIAGRNRAELEGLIGFLLNTLVLRTDLTGAPDFLELLGRVRATTLDAYAHQALPFEKLLFELQPNRDLGRSPLFQVFFNMLNPVSEAPTLQGLTLELLPGTDVGAKFDLTLYAVESGGGIALNLAYNADLFDRARVRGMLEQLQMLLSQIAESPGERIGHFSLVTPEASALLPDPAAPLAEPAFDPLVRLFLACAERHGGDPAICGSGRTWSFSELATHSRELARALQTQGVAPGDVVAVCGPRCHELIAGLLGVVLAGGVLLTLDRKLPEHRRRVMLEEAGARCLVSVGEAATGNDELLGLPGLRIVWVPRPLEPAAAPWTEGRFRLPPDPHPNAPAYVFFTSGTTGVPKAVLGRQKGLSHFLSWQRDTFEIGPGDRVAQLTGLSFDVVLRDIFLALTTGAVLDLPDAEDDMSPESVLCWLEANGITVLHTVPSLASLWLEQVPPVVGLASLRWVFFAGEPLPGRLVQRWRAKFPKAGGIVNLYGPTETTLAKCFYPVPDPPRPGTQPVGSALPQAQALVLTGAQRLCGVGEPGEIVLRTPFRSLGYLNAGEEDQRRFRKNPFRDDDRDLLYFSGDLGRYLPDGTLEILGRLDDQVKIRGMRVEPEEVRMALARHPAVRKSAVLIREDRGGDKHLVAYVVPQVGASCEPAELRQHLVELLPDFMVPSAFVILEALPLTPNGKLDRKALPAPDSAPPATPDHLVPPRTPIQEELARLWEDLLGVAPIGIHDDFFVLGGHSLAAVRLRARIEERFGKTLPMAELFRRRTIEDLAHVLGDQPGAEPSSPVVVLRPGAAGQPPFFCVHPAGGLLTGYQALARHLEIDQPFYGLQGRGIGGDEEPHVSVAEMASHYLAAVRAVQPEGPYFLGGWSFGGRVAFEMARQLVSQGEDVAALVLLDSAAPAGVRLERDLDQAGPAILALLAQSAGLSVTEAELLPLEPEQQMAHIAHLAEAAGLLPESTAMVHLEIRLALFNAHARAAESYAPSVYPGRITFLRAAEPSNASTELTNLDPSRGWTAYSSQPIVVHPVPGDHQKMMREPHVRAVAGVLRRILAEARANGAAPGAGTCIQMGRG